MKKTIEKRNYKTKLLSVIIFVAILIPLLAGQCSSPPEVKNYNLDIVITGTGQVELSTGKTCKASCTESLAEDSEVILTAKLGTSTTATGAVINWSGDCSGSTNSCTLKMDSDKTVSVSFDNPGEKNYRLKLEPTGPGSIVSSAIGINCSSDCEKQIKAGSSITLVAHEDQADSKFLKWGGNCHGVKNECTVLMNTNKIVTAEFIKNEVISVPDANLAKKLREKFGLAANEDITKAHMLNLTFFRTGFRYNTPDNEKISSLEGLQYAVNLSYLSLQYNKITDISQLHNLKKLQTLELGANKITDVTALKALTNLKKLFLSYNKITDFTTLKDLAKLESLGLSGTRQEKLIINNISFLKNLSKLKDLYLSNTIPGDLSILKDLKELKTLYLMGAINQSRLSEIKDLTNLETLSIGDNGINDITVIKDFVKLQTLSLERNIIKDISVLEKMIDLEFLSMSHNLISNIDALVNNSGLTGDKDWIYIKYNCLDITTGDDKANIDKLINRGIKLTYDPQKTRGCP